MATVTHFDQLPVELIRCIFDFLAPAQRYHSFFDCGPRLRALVKKRTEFSRKGLDADIHRFSTLHSWYKHLTFDDDDSLYYIVPMKGQQPRYSFDPCVRDADGLHWWFICEGGEKIITDKRVRAIVTRYPIRLNPFFYHQYMVSDRATGAGYFGCGGIILSRNDTVVRSWLSTNYPDHVDQIFQPSEDDFHVVSKALTPVFEGEWTKLTATTLEVAVQIWNELKELSDVNPLQMLPNA